MTAHNVQGHTLPLIPRMLQGGWDYAALAYASRFEDLGVWMRADKRGCVSLYQACALNSGIAEDEDREYNGAVMLLFGK